jgi:hypothetical protein
MFYLPEFKSAFDPTCSNCKTDGFCGEIGNYSWVSYPSVGELTGDYYNENANTTIFNYEDVFDDYYAGG